MPGQSSRKVIPECETRNLRCNRIPLQRIPVWGIPVQEIRRKKNPGGKRRRDVIY